MVQVLFGEGLIEMQSFEEWWLLVGLGKKGAFLCLWSQVVVIWTCGGVSTYGRVGAQISGYWTGQDMHGCERPYHDSSLFVLGQNPAQCLTHASF